MNRIILIVVIFFLGAAQAEVYRYTNKQGKTAYSDVPVSGAEKIVVPPVMTYKAPVIVEETPESAKKKAPPPGNLEQQGAEGVIYETLKIISPQDGMTPPQNAGTIDVQYFLFPTLQGDDRVILYRNGEAQEGLRLTNLTRGELSLRLVVLDIEGREKISSEEITIHVKKHSILLPRPNVKAKKAPQAPTAKPAN